MGLIQHGCPLLEGERSRQEGHRLPAPGPQLRPPSHEGKCTAPDCCSKWLARQLQWLTTPPAPPFFFSLHQDVPLISLANIFQNARLWEDALTVARMAVEIAPHFVVNHFTLANVYITMVAASLPGLSPKVLAHREPGDTTRLINTKVQMVLQRIVVTRRRKTMVRWILGGYWFRSGSFKQLFDLTMKGFFFFIYYLESVSKQI